jgi:hypothetical protein
MKNEKRHKKPNGKEKFHKSASKNTKKSKESKTELNVLSQLKLIDK